MKLRRGNLITNKKYITSANTILKIECDNNHLFEATYANLKKGMWCYNCNNCRGEFVTRKICEKIFDKQFKKIRPDWLKNKTGCNLELDIYNEELKLAFEYNGEQHYKFNKYFHESEDAFEKQQERDKLKGQLCKQHNVTLIVVPYTVQEKDIYDYILEQLDENDIDYTKPKNKILIK